jgi:NTP pyrophosphatase (non-canonical NTP hydrolase)
LVTDSGIFFIEKAISIIHNSKKILLLNKISRLKKYLYFMSDLDRIKELLIKFRDERDWEQFHNPKDLAMALSIESAELLEVFLWKKPEDANLEKVKEELADVLAYAILLSHHYNINIIKIIEDKIAQNALKYPVDKAKGKSDKYNEL